VTLFVVFVLSCMSARSWSTIEGRGYLVVDNNGLEDATIYMYPSRELLGHCVSLSRCEFSLSRFNMKSLRFGDETISYRRSGRSRHEMNRIMPRMHTDELTLIVGRYDSDSWLIAR